jgi:uncharacterized protein YbbK (DUF523 family)
MRPVLVSACLAGVHSRYDGGCNSNTALIERLQHEGCLVIPVCPEQLGGLPTPRPAAEITSGDGRSVLDGESSVLTEDGADVTQNYVRGAEEAVRIAALLGCTHAYLAEKSPSCGTHKLKRKGQTCEGQGVASALLEAAGVVVVGVEPSASDS